MAAPSQKKIFDSDKEVLNNLCKFVIDKSKDSIANRGIFTVGVSGGSLAKFLCNGLPAFKEEAAFQKWRFFFCDERHVPYNDPECTYSIYKAGLTDKVGMEPDVHVFPINPDLSVEDAAVDYEKKIRTVFPGTNVPKFDLLLLGMGPDGHTCSLFPGHGLLEEKDRIIAPISDSPKPPPKRVTMTYPIINNCRCAVFASCGEGKADIVQKVLEVQEGELLPAARVKPTNGEVIWFLDKGAASKLKNI